MNHIGNISVVKVHEDIDSLELGWVIGNNTGEKDIQPKLLQRW